MMGHQVVRRGARVQTFDGEPVGTVISASEGRFQVRTGGGEAFWLRGEALLAVEGEGGHTVTLICHANGIGRYRQGGAPAPPRAASR
jgi:hypothetical protein